MAYIRLFFNFLVAISLFSCHPARKTATPSLELKSQAAAFPRTDTFLQQLLTRHPQYFDTILTRLDLVQAQVIYTRIDRKRNNAPVFTHYYFNVHPGRYFYPASTVKMPTALLALEKLNELEVKGLDRNSTMITDQAHSGQSAVYNDPTSEDGRPTAAHYIKKIFLVSDNDAYNRLYEFLGQEYLNMRLQAMGYDSVQLVHRLEVALSEEQNRATNPVVFYDTAARALYRQPLMKSTLPYQPVHISLGKGYMSSQGLVNAPFDFSKKNRLSLPDLHSILLSTLFPEAVPRQQRFHLTKDDYRFLYRHMSMLPRESRYPQYDTSYSDAYVKFLVFGGSGAIADPHVRVFNKVGDAYGFLTDVAYVVDFQNKVEFLLSATIYCNSDGIFNDDRYDYQQLGFPFLKNLGRVIYEYERQRPRKHLPDLSRFRFNYKD